MGKLEGKVSIITGAGSGIGKSTAILFAKEGSKVVVVDYGVEGGEKTVDLINKDGGEAIFIEADVSKSADVQRAITSTVDEYGKLDILHNNAGVEGILAPMHESTEENFDRVISINLRGVFLGMKYGIIQMLKQGGGVIINTASVAGLIGFPNITAYCASKGGVVQLTKTAALEYATQNIRINCICPGIIWTPMLERFTGGDEETKKQFTAMEPVGRMGKPEEVAQAVLFLASDDASFVTGVPFPVDGGYIAQ